ncbi:centromere-associated protein E-like [Enoplosus armatus]|uniref:centromere-associated protein E-like n=1 Tax=Enoplosus armatus TaxID=215367 RepID=UPI003993EF2A
MTEESAVKVCVRVRPLIAREESAASETAEPAQLFWKADKKSIHQIDDGNSTKSFSFDRVFTAEETTNQLYQGIAKPLVVSTVEGYNGTIFAYGQTSSGKTFTMMGSDHIPGVIPLAVEDVFQTIKNCPKKEFLLRVSYMEIYNETVTDLLVDSWKRKPLEVREALNKNIYVADLTEELVTSPAQALAWVRKGEKNRHYGKTKMNQRSSRSHTIFRMILESRERSDPASGENADGAIIVSHLNLVDLAGSERASQTGAEGTRFKEGCNINRSLFTLGQVIKKLTDEGQKGFTNYRDSKLTRILQNSLGGNAKTVIICTITPVTLDETLSTLQFASTAKKMKNDPHVTEVSDDGALLKRYRNEIVDLKRRLQEVSSVTQTTATEKKVLSQLLQEKDQLQREQQDRIRNLTKLLVTSSNSVPVQKMPKRRVTWGGKMLRLGRPSACDGGSSDLSFAESVTRKRKADSCLLELGEDDEDFDSHWEIPDESDEMEMSQTLDGRVAELELQLQTEARQKLEALEKIQPTEQRVAELELQLQMEAREKLEALEKVEMLEFRVADLDRRLEEQSHSQSETGQQMRREFAETIQLCETLATEKDAVAAERDYLKQELGMFIEQTESLEREKDALSQELEEKRDTDEFKSLEEEFRKEHENELQKEISSLKTAIDSSELRRQELQNKLESVSEELKKKTVFAEELQSMSGKDLTQEVARLRRSLDDAEGLSRDTKKDWAVLRSRNIALEEVNLTLTANHEKMEAEVNSLSVQLDTERSRYRKMQSDLQKELNVAFNENTKLTSLLDGKVPKNLIDSVELERTVANVNKELAASREAEGALRAQLEELASFQTLPDKVDGLTKQVCELTEELCAVQAHRDSLLLGRAQSQEEAQQLRDALQTSQDEVARIQADLGAAVLGEKDVTQQLHSLRSDLERSDAERSRLTAAVEETGVKLEERERHVASLEEKLNETRQLAKDLEEKLADSDASRTTEEEISKELQEQLSQLTEELQRVQAEKDALLSAQNEKEALLVAGARSSTEETERLLSTVASLTAERDQLKTDLQENVEMMIDNQEELRTALEKICEQREQIKQLETAQTPKQDGPPSEMSAQLEELHTRMRTLTEELERVEAEKESSRQTSTEETETLLRRVTSLTEDRDRLQETLEGLRREKQQLRAELEDRMDTVARAQSGLSQPEMLTSELQARDEKITQLEQEIEQLQATLQAVGEQKSQLEDDLQRNVETATETQSILHSLQEQNQRNLDLERLNQELEQQVAETQCLLHSLEEELQEQKQKNSDHLKLCEQKESDLDQQTKTLTEQLESARAERDALLLEKESSRQTSTEETETLLHRVTSLTEDRDQLQETLEGLRREKQQLRAELEDRMDMCEFQQQLSSGPQSLMDEQEAQRLLQIQQLEGHLEKTKEEVSQLKCDLQENVELMIENQEELRASQEKIRVLQVEINALRSREAELEVRPGSGSDAESTLRSQELQTQIQRLTEELERAGAERDACSEETETLLRRVASLTEDRDQLRETLEGLRREKQQLRAELDDRMETLQTEMSTLTKKLERVEAEKESSRQTSTEETEALLRRVTSLSEDRDRLQEALEGLRRERQQLRAELETLQTEMRTLTEKLERVEAEKESSRQTSTEETEALLRRVTSLSEDRDRLQETLEGLRRERQQLGAELEDRMDTVQQLEEQLLMYRERQSHAEAEANASQQLLSDANATVSALREQLSSLDQSSGGDKETAASRLQDSTGQLQESFGRFQHFIDTCSKYNSAAPHKALRLQCSLKHSYLPSLPKPTMITYSTVCQLGLKTVQSLGNMTAHLQVQAQVYRNLFEEMVKKDLAVFEERRLQDVLLCRVQAPSYSVKDEDLHARWEHRLAEVLDKRRLYLQKMASILETLWANMASYPSDVSAEIRERERFQEQLQAVYADQPEPVCFSQLDRILSCELDRRSAVAQSRKAILQGVIDEQSGLCKELKLLEVQADSQLREERSKSSTLLRALEEAPRKTELSLLKDNQKLVLQLQQTEERVSVLCVQNEQLEDAQIKANNRVSNHKQATQLLQTELQDSRAQVEERERAIQTLRSKLRESERNASPSAVELEKLQNKLFKMEVELSSASDKHQQEIQRMTTLLNEKEASLRKLKETLRKSQQQEEESFLQGEDLHARLTNPRGLVIKSSILQEKTKLEEEVKQLERKISELESLVSSQQAEIGKWKSRAVKLKVKSKTEVDQPSSPSTPTKRGLPMTSESSNFLNSPKKFLLTSPKRVLDSPRKLPGSPKVSLLDSPKSRFFDAGGSSELLSRTCPKQFFDNSSLGTIPEVSQVPDAPDAEKDAAGGADRKEEWWPQSPKQEDMCRTQ